MKLRVEWGRSVPRNLGKRLAKQMPRRYQLCNHELAVAWLPSGFEIESESAPLEAALAIAAAVRDGIHEEQGVAPLFVYWLQQEQLDGNDAV